MDIKRLIALGSTTVECLFAEFDRLRAEYNVEIEDIYNMDETGFRMGQTTKNCVIYDPSFGRPQAPNIGNTHWVSIIECVGVNRAIKLYMIFQGRAPKDHMFPRNKDLPDIIWAFSPKGWTDNELGVDWLKRIFIPQPKKGLHSILLLDNHDSHTTGEFQYHCLENNILHFISLLTRPISYNHSM